MDLNDYLIDTHITDFMCKVNLADEECALKHNDEEDHPAVDYLCQRFGQTNDDGTYTIDFEVRIPICSECAEGLYDENWILFYCVKCNESQWLSRRLARREYPKEVGIIWFDECPHCFGIE